MVSSIVPSENFKTSKRIHTKRVTTTPLAKWDVKKRKSAWAMASRRGLEKRRSPSRSRIITSCTPVRKARHFTFDMEERRWCSSTGTIKIARNRTTPNWEERLDIMPRKLAVDTNDAVSIVETTTDINALDEEREMNVTHREGGNEKRNGSLLSTPEANRLIDEICAEVLQDTPPSTPRHEKTMGINDQYRVDINVFDNSFDFDTDKDLQIKSLNILIKKQGELLVTERKLRKEAELKERRAYVKGYSKGSCETRNLTIKQVNLAMSPFKPDWKAKNTPQSINIGGEIGISEYARIEDNEQIENDYFTVSGGHNMDIIKIHLDQMNRLKDLNQQVVSNMEKKFDKELDEKLIIMSQLRKKVINLNTELKTIQKGLAGLIVSSRQAITNATIEIQMNCKTLLSYVDEELSDVRMKHEKKKCNDEQACNAISQQDSLVLSPVSTLESWNDFTYRFKKAIKSQTSSIEIRLIKKLNKEACLRIKGKLGELGFPNNRLSPPRKNLPSFETTSSYFSCDTNASLIEDDFQDSLSF